MKKARLPSASVLGIFILSLAISKAILIAQFYPKREQVHIKLKGKTLDKASDPYF